LGNKEIIYYKRYVDELLNIFYQNKINEEAIQRTSKNLDHNILFKRATGENNTKSYFNFM
jgi:competence transcription factor ComK